MIKDQCLSQKFFYSSLYTRRIACMTSIIHVISDRLHTLLCLQLLVVALGIIEKWYQEQTICLHTGYSSEFTCSKTILVSADGKGPVLR
jgi:hypothetical protein